MSLSLESPRASILASCQRRWRHLVFFFFPKDEIRQQQQCDIVVAVFTRRFEYQPYVNYVVLVNTVDFLNFFRTFSSRQHKDLRDILENNI